MGISEARNSLFVNIDYLAAIVMLAAGFHTLLWIAAVIFIAVLKIPRGKRESVFFMSGQKTLPLAVILQVSIFPQYPVVLVVCVLHQIIHLFMDGYLVGKTAIQKY